MSLALTHEGHRRHNEKSLIRTKRLIALQVYATFFGGALLLALLLGVGRPHGRNRCCLRRPRAARDPEASSAVLPLALSLSATAAPRLISATRRSCRLALSQSNELLRALTGTWPVAEPRLSLGVVWYLPAGTTGSAADGQKLSYLNQPNRFRSCDPRLYDALGQLFNGGDRSLGAVEASGILGDGTVFFDGPVPQDQWSRRRWFQQAVQAVQGRDVVFLDPDKGLAPPSAGLSSTDHAYVHELEAFVRSGQTVVVYHHLGRTAAHPVQMRDWAERLARELRLDAEPHILWYRRGTARAYFVIPADAHAKTIDERLERFRRSPWFERRHFTLLPLEPLSPFRGSEMAPSSAALHTLEEDGAPFPTEGVAKLLATGESQIVEFKSTARWNVRAVVDAEHLDIAQSHQHLAHARRVVLHRDPPWLGHR